MVILYTDSYLMCPIKFKSPIWPLVTELNEHNFPSWAKYWSNHHRIWWIHNVSMVMYQTVREYVPHRTVKVCPRDKPWINKEVKSLIKKRDHLYRRYKRSQRIEHFDTYITVKTQVNTSIVQAKENHTNKLISKLEDPKTPPKQYWNTLKQT